MAGSANGRSDGGRARRSFRDRVTGWLFREEPSGDGPVFTGASKEFTEGTTETVAPPKLRQDAAPPVTAPTTAPTDDESEQLGELLENHRSALGRLRDRPSRLAIAERDAEEARQKLSIAEKHREKAAEAKAAKTPENTPNAKWAARQAEGEFEAWDRVTAAFQSEAEAAGGRLTAEKEYSAEKQLAAKEKALGDFLSKLIEQGKIPPQVANELGIELAGTGGKTTVAQQQLALRKHFDPDFDPRFEQPDAPQDAATADAAAEYIRLTKLIRTNEDALSALSRDSKNSAAIVGEENEAIPKLTRQSKAAWNAAKAAHPNAKSSFNTAIETQKNLNLSIVLKEYYEGRLVANRGKAEEISQGTDSLQQYSGTILHDYQCNPVFQYIIEQAPPSQTAVSPDMPPPTDAKKSLPLPDTCEAPQREAALGGYGRPNPNAYYDTIPRLTAAASTDTAAAHEWDNEHC